MLRAISAVDVALWDVIERDAGLSLYRCLSGGGRQDEVQAYASGGYVHMKCAEHVGLTGEVWSVLISQEIAVGGPGADTDTSATGCMCMHLLKLRTDLDGVQTEISHTLWVETWAYESALEGSLLVLGLIGAQAIQKTRSAEELENSLNELKGTQTQLVQSAKPRWECNHG